MQHSAEQIQSLIFEIETKYSEWLEMAGSNSPILLNFYLAEMILKERADKEFYKKIAYQRQKQTIKI